MKIVMIAYSEAIDDEIMDLLESNSVEGYTKWTKILGNGANSGPHLLSHVWPKGNNVIMCCVQDDKAEKLLKGVRELRQTVGHEGVKAFSMPVDEVT